MTPLTCTQISAVIVAFGALAAPPAHAYSTFEIVVQDDPGEGFNDPTPATPVGRNMGTTLGEQRLNALQHAADQWGAVLDSDVPIVIAATFDPIACSGAGATTLALGGSFGLDIVTDPNGEERVMPTALADRLVGDDLWPGDPDISIQFNSSIDDGCIEHTVWYYGLDASPAGFDADMIDTALHEIGHGLGFQPGYDEETGALLGVPSPFMEHLLDLDSGKHFHEMTDAERLASQVNVRRIVWDGERTTQAALALLQRGMPTIESEQVPELSGFTADVNYGDWPLSMSLSADLVIPPDAACPDFGQGLNGRIVLLREACVHSSWLAFIESEGAVGALMEQVTGFGQPPLPVDEDGPEPAGIPAVAIGEADLQRLVDAVALGTVTVALTLDDDGLLGADEDGHVMLHTTEQLSASSLAHFEQLARPSLLMEPISSPRVLHDLDLTPALMHDLGWERFCGNSEIDQEEECDEGDDNSDTEPDACRTSCARAACGDGVLDDGEACDEGDDNSDTAANACRSSCERASCGDGVRDMGEGCDDGADNSDTAADACRTSCEPARCGDGARDMGEGCDEGEDNSDTQASACRTSCEAARCGDGVVDDGEECDDAASNGDAPDACRSSCEAARCGDGVIDSTETCDPGLDPACVEDCQAIDPTLVDGGVDGGRGIEGSGGPLMKADDGGCGCRVVRGSAPSSQRGATGIGLIAALSVLAVRVRNRRAKPQ